MQKFFESQPMSVLCVAAALAVTTWGASTALAQPVAEQDAARNVSKETQAATIGQAKDVDEAAQAEQAPNSRFHWNFNTGLSHQTRTDIDDGGDFAATRFSANAGAAVQLTEALSLNLNAGYERHEFRFSSVTNLGNEPWENINILAMQAALGYQLNPHWTLFGSPLLSLAAEDGADLSNAYTGGVAFGAHYAHNENFNIGFGLGVISQLEDSIAVFPIIRFNWKIAEQWTLRSGSFTLGVQGGAGLELEWQPCDNFALSAGVQYQLRRFRLNDSGVAPKGVGEESAVPVYLRMTWLPCQNFTVNGFAGVLFGGKLELFDEDGHSVGREDFDPAFVMGARVGVQF